MVAKLALASGGVLIDTVDLIHTLEIVQWLPLWPLPEMDLGLSSEHVTGFQYRQSAFKNMFYQQE